VKQKTASKLNAISALTSCYWNDCTTHWKTM